MEHKALAVELFNKTWDYLDRTDRNQQDDLVMVNMAHTSLYHWSQVGTLENMAIGYWQISRVYAVLGWAESALSFAFASKKVCQDNHFDGFNLAYAYEAIARGYSISKHYVKAREYVELGFTESEKVTIMDDRALLVSDLKTIILD